MKNTLVAFIFIFSSFSTINIDCFGAEIMLSRVPFLQTATQNSIIVCWSDEVTTGTTVEYGTTNALGSSTTGSSEYILKSKNPLYCWHSVKLTGLTPNTQYYYRVKTNGGTSLIYTFKTLPDATYLGKLRFLMFSDSHTLDTTMCGKTVRAAREKVIALYGSDFQNQITGIIHTGDIVHTGSDSTQYNRLFFAPFKHLTPYLSTMIVTGNHENASRTSAVGANNPPLFYNYLKYDDFSAIPTDAWLKEKMWSFKVANTLFIGLDNNEAGTTFSTQVTQLDAMLSAAQVNFEIDMVFVLFHQMPYGKIWSAGESAATRTQILPIIAKYDKVKQLTYGHTHGYERGTIHSNTSPNSDYTIVCNGGAGGGLDKWKTSDPTTSNKNYNNIHVAIANYSYSILEIDVANKSYNSKMYSIGTSANPKNNVMMDNWHRNPSLEAPNTPKILSINNTGINSYLVNTSAYSGVDSLMSVQIQVSPNIDFNTIAVDSIVNWKDIFGATLTGTGENGNPIDLHAGIDLTTITLNTTIASPYFRVRHRDHNLKWSNWSNNYITEIRQDEKTNNLKDRLFANSPNPFNQSTKISYNLVKATDVIIRLYGIDGKEIDKLQDGYKEAGFHSFIYNRSRLNAGIYYYQLFTPEFVDSKKMIVVN